MLVILRVPLPVLVRVIALAALVSPTITPPRFRMAGTSLTVPVVIVITAVADLVVSFTETALSATVGLAGTAAGAV